MATFGMVGMAAFGTLGGLAEEATVGLAAPVVALAVAAVERRGAAAEISLAGGTAGAVDVIGGSATGGGVAAGVAWMATGATTGPLGAENCGGTAGDYHRHGCGGGCDGFGRGSQTGKLGYGCSEKSRHSDPLFVRWTGCLLLQARCCSLPSPGRSCN